MQQVVFRNLGSVDYKEAWDYQEKLFQTIIAQKLANRVGGNVIETTKSYLLFCEHPHVYTLGKSGSQDNLLVNKNQLQDANASFYKINRGGDITYHGPGQLVVYPILDLDICAFWKRLLFLLSQIMEYTVRVLRDLPVYGSM